MQDLQSLLLRPTPGAPLFEDKHVCQDDDRVWGIDRPGACPGSYERWWPKIKDSLSLLSAEDLNQIKPDGQEYKITLLIDEEWGGIEDADFRYVEVGRVTYAHVSMIRQRFPPHQVLFLGVTGIEMEEI